MARFSITTGLLGLLCLAGLADKSGLADDFPLKSTALFDGESLAGWEGEAYWFRIEEKSIVAGRLTETIPHNYFLCTTEEFGDFELRLEAKLIGDGKNAGIQFRSKRVPGETEVVGYQADMGEMRDRLIWGSLYDEGRRRKFLGQMEAEPLRQLVKSDDWNSIRIRCLGPHIQIFINDVQTVDFKESDSDVSKSGVIGLQIHSGKPAEAWYRNIRIRTLLPSTDSTTTK